MSSEKPEKHAKTTHPHKPPEEAVKPKKKHRLRNAVLGVAAAFGLGGLAAGGCAPAARAQETTPRTSVTTVQSPEVRVASSETPARPPETRVAQVPPSTETSTYTGTSTGGNPPNPTERVYHISPPGEQPEVISAEEFQRDYGYTFQNAGATVSTLPVWRETLTLGDWEVYVSGVFAQTAHITVRNRSLNFEESFDINKDAKVVLLPFPETDNARGPMLAIFDVRVAVNYFFNKVSNCVTSHVFDFSNTTGIPDVGTDIYEGEPYLFMAPPGSVTSDGSMAPGTRFYQYALATTARDGDGPGAGGRFFEIR